MDTLSLNLEELQPEAQSHKPTITIKLDEATTELVRQYEKATGASMRKIVLVLIRKGHEAAQTENAS